MVNKTCEHEFGALGAISEDFCIHCGTTLAEANKVCSNGHRYNLYGYCVQCDEDISKTPVTAHDRLTWKGVLSHVTAERDRQDLLKANGKFEHTCADDITNDRKLTILTEEFGEVARAINDNMSPEEIFAELIQVAAIALAWCECYV